MSSPHPKGTSLHLWIAIVLKSISFMSKECLPSLDMSRRTSFGLPICFLPYLFQLFIGKAVHDRGHSSRKMAKPITLTTGITRLGRDNGPNLLFVILLDYFTHY
jgi:hypothetical protein